MGMQHTFGYNFTTNLSKEEVENKVYALPMFHENGISKEDVEINQKFFTDVDFNFYSSFIFQDELHKAMLSLINEIGCPGTECHTYYHPNEADCDSFIVGEE